MNTYRVEVRGEILPDRVPADGWRDAGAKTAQALRVPAEDVRVEVDTKVGFIRL